MKMSLFLQGTGQITGKCYMKHYFAPYIFLFLSFFSFNCQGQDPAFTQFFTVPVHLNPAFAGATEQYRFATLYRNHWTNLDGSYQTNMATLDFNLPDLNSGIGFLVSNDRITGGGLSTTQAALVYSYSIPLRGGWMARGGFQFGMLWRNLNYNKLIFGDQIENGTSSSKENLNQGSIFRPTIGSGLALFNEFFWMGIAVHQMNEPVLSQVGSASVLPARINIHMGGNIPLNYHPSHLLNLLPAILYQRQGEFDQLDLGTSMRYNAVSFGAFYRGMSFVKSSNGIAHKSIGLLFGVNLNDWRFGYAFDFPLGAKEENLGGSHEISLLFHPPAKSRFRRKIKNVYRIFDPVFNGY